MRIIKSKINQEAFYKAEINNFLTRIHQQLYMLEFHILFSSLKKIIK